MKELYMGRKDLVKDIVFQVIDELNAETERKALGMRDARLYNKWDKNEDDKKDLEKTIKNGQHYLKTKGNFNVQNDPAYQKGFKEEQAKLAKQALLEYIVEGTIKDRNKEKKNELEIKNAESKRQKDQVEGFLDTVKGQKMLNQKACHGLDKSKNKDNEKAINLAKHAISNATHKLLGRKDVENPHKVGSSPVYKNLYGNLEQKAEAIKSHGPAYSANKEEIRKNIERERKINPKLSESCQAFLEIVNERNEENKVKKDAWERKINHISAKEKAQNQAEIKKHADIAKDEQKCADDCDKIAMQAGANRRKFEIYNDKYQDHAQRAGWSNAEKQDIIDKVRAKYTKTRN